ncbi:MAG: replicative DNA helicase [Planctomycetota bacterium]
MAENPEQRERPPQKRPNRGNGQPAREPGRGAALERLLPQDVEAERAVLGSMLLEEHVTPDVITVLREAGAEAFSREPHRELYRTLIELHDQHRPFDEHVLKDELTRRGLFEQLGGFDFLAGLISTVPSALRARHYAGLVYQAYLLRQLVAAAHRITEKAFDADEPTRDILDYAEQEILTVTERRATGEAEPLPGLVEQVYARLAAHDGGPTGAPSGFPELDRLTCGFQASELIIVAGRPSMGKTALGLNMAEHLAIHERRPVLFFSLEMGRYQVAQRILCSQARVNAHRMRLGQVDDKQLRALQEMVGVIGEAPFFLDDRADLTIFELRARARIAHRRHKICAVFVDYLQLVRAPRSENRQMEVAAVSRGLKALAKDLNVPVIAMAQLNRATEDKMRIGNRPRMSDLRESGAIEQDADLIALIHRESYYKKKPDADGGEAPPTPEDNVAELIIDKQRNGPTGIVKLLWHREYTKFVSYAPDMDPGYIPQDHGASPF